MCFQIFATIAFFSKDWLQSLESYSLVCLLFLSRATPLYCIPRNFALFMNHCSLLFLYVLKIVVLNFPDDGIILFTSLRSFCLSPLQSNSVVNSFCFLTLLSIYGPIYGDTLVMWTTRSQMKKRL